MGNEVWGIVWNFFVYCCDCFDRLYEWLSVQFTEKLCPNHECYIMNRKLMKIQFPAAPSLVDPRSATRVLLKEEDTTQGYACTNPPGCCSTSTGITATTEGWLERRPACDCVCKEPDRGDCEEHTAESCSCLECIAGRGKHKLPWAWRTAALHLCSLLKVR